MEKINVIKRDALRVELRNIEEDMKGISPKLSIYKSLQLKAAQIRKTLSMV